MIKLFIVVVIAILGVAAPHPEYRVSADTSAKAPEQPKVIAKLPEPKVEEKAAVAPVEVPKEAPKPVVQAANTTAGNCEEYFAKAGITDLVNARILLSKENASCDPQRWNMAGSSACGIAQELPCGKSGCGIPPNGDGLCQVQWQKRYVEGRYGSYAAAVAFHNLHNWY